MSSAWQEVYSKPKREPAVAVVPWAYKKWNEFTDQDKRGLRDHLIVLKRDRGIDRVKQYCVYLHHWCGAPADLFKQAQQYLEAA